MKKNGKDSAPSYCPPEQSAPGSLEAQITGRPLLHPVRRSIDTPLADCPTNLDIRSARDRVWIFNAGNPADFRLEGTLPLKFRAVAYLLLPDERTDPDTGEIREFERLVLFNKDGKTFCTTSAFGWKRAKAAAEIFSPQEWEAGILFVIQVRQGESKRWYHDIRVCIDNEDVLGPEVDS